eukprot:COSAG02_NODE_890_length_16155_cov_63.407885_3_plen_92_part_00
MDDFIPPETVPQLSRKRPRLDDQIEEYRKNAAKRHAEMFANTLAESADSAAVDVASMSDYECCLHFSNNRHKPTLDIADCIANAITGALVR